MRIVAFLIFAPIAFALSIGLVVLGFIGIVAVVDLTDSLSHVLWPFFGALPIVVVFWALIQEPLRALRELTPSDSGINVATPNEVYWTRMEEAKRVYLSEVEQGLIVLKVRKRTKYTDKTIPPK